MHGQVQIEMVPGTLLNSPHWHQAPHPAMSGGLQRPQSQKVSGVHCLFRRCDVSAMWCEELVRGAASRCEVVRGHCEVVRGGARALRGGARWCEMVRDGARSVRGGARWYEVVRGGQCVLSASRCEVVRGGACLFHVTRRTGAPHQLSVLSVARYLEHTPSWD